MYTARMNSKRLNLALDDDTYRRMAALAEANFPKPSGDGNITTLVRTLVNQAYHYPERFGLISPFADDPGAPTPKP
jgi:hypothetical protein